MAAVVTVSGTLIINMRQVGEAVADAPGWSISYEFDGINRIRTEAGSLTEADIGKYIVVNLKRQHLNIYIDSELVLSSLNFAYNAPRNARYGMRILPEHVGDIQFVFISEYSAPPMGSGPTFSFINRGLPLLDYLIISFCIFAGIASLTLALAFGIKNTGNRELYLFTLLNFLFAAYIVSQLPIGMNFMSPGVLYYLNNILFFIYTLPMFALLYLVLGHALKKWSLIAVIPPVIYSAVAITLGSAGLIDLDASTNYYNHVVALCLMILTVLLALQPKTQNRYSIIARIHLLAFFLWGLTAAIRLGVLGELVYVNVEFMLMYSFVLLTLTLTGAAGYARRMKELQEREYTLGVITENQQQTYLQMKNHIDEVNGLKHEIKNHIATLQIYFKDELYKDAEAYLEKYAGEAIPIIETVYHENSMINASVHKLTQKAKEHGIKVKLNLAATPRKISDHDFYSLLINIIDNALESCIAMSDDSKTFINLAFTRHEPYLNIRCENSMEGELQHIDGRIKTSKSGSGHGYGLLTIERIVDTYDGFMDAIGNEGVFTIAVALRD